MTRRFRKKEPSKIEKEKKEKKEKREKLPYLPPTQKILDIEKDMNDVIYPPDLEERKEQRGFFKRMSASTNKFKYRIMKKFNLPEIYTDILFFTIEFLIAVLIIYIIMRILLAFKAV
jgi:hypothetical protein